MPRTADQRHTHRLDKVRSRQVSDLIAAASSILWRAVLLPGLLFALLPFSGCGRAQEARFETNDDLTITFATDPSPAMIGLGNVVVTVHDAEGRPIDGALVNVEGNMSHAGMVPSSGTTEASENGVYRVPLDWSMGGDWIVDVTVNLPDGQIARRRFSTIIDILCTTE